MDKNPVCELLGIEYPVIQGGMAWIADAQLAAAVSNAGGLGIIAGGSAPIDYLRDQIRRCKSLTDKPFGVNIMLAAPNADEVAALVVEEGVKIVTTGAGSPAPYMEDWLKAGIRVIPVVASVAYALKMQELGATAVIAEGAESGGHIGDIHTMSLVPQIIDALDIPVMAAGGIFDGRGAAAAFMLGACGVQVGTRFLIADECHIHENYKERLIKATEIGTMVTGKSLGDACRCLKNPFAKKFFKMEYDPEVPKEEVLKFGTGAVRKAVFDGNINEGSMLAGEVAGMIKKKETAAEIVEDIIGGAEKLLAGAKDLLY